jgi:hypothetical protein
VCVCVCVCVYVYVCLCEKSGRGGTIKEASSKCLECAGEDEGTKSFFRNVTKFTSLPKASYMVHREAVLDKSAQIVTSPNEEIEQI